MPGTSTSGGRNRKAERLHLLQGTFRADRHADQRTPEPPTGRPTPPIALTGTARAEWDRMIVRLERCAVLSVVDDGVLFEACQLFEETQRLKADEHRLRRLSATLTKATKGLTGVDLVSAVAEIVKLQAQIARLSTAIRQGHMAMRQYLIELGLTPLARNRVKVSTAAPAGSSDAKKQRYLDGLAAK
jgi:phage terminase small subunit